MVGSVVGVVMRVVGGQGGIESRLRRVASGGSLCVGQLRLGLFAGGDGGHGGRRKRILWRGANGEVYQSMYCQSSKSSNQMQRARVQCRIRAVVARFLISISNFGAKGRKILGELKDTKARARISPSTTRPIDKGGPSSRRGHGGWWNEHETVR